MAGVLDNSFPRTCPPLARLMCGGLVRHPCGGSMWRNEPCSPWREGRPLSLGFYLFCLLVAGLIGICFAPQTASGATYFVSAADGNDSNPGTSDQPWKTLDRAYTRYSGSGNKVVEGDTVLFKNGSYGAFRENTDDGS
ncbi:MAG: hypothetical protein MUP16_04625, partial [Sedimentisphaerales bacterium]|nr:hypothetical protein [Sedimentisphaerales bacterium]